MNSQNELVSIGLPVYNGMPSVKKAIESVLAQTYPNIELIISDNPSTDGTQALCEEYARRDKRVRYIRHKDNIGAIGNYNFAFKESKGEYFFWVSYDDFLDPHLVEECAALLRKDKEAAMAMSDFAHVNMRGEVTHKMNPEDFVVRERDLYSRLKHFILMDWGGGKAMTIHGLWRRTVIEGDEYRDLPDGDINFSFRGLSRGPFLFVNKVLFYKGVLPGGESRIDEPLTSGRMLSALITRLKLIQTHALSMKYAAGIHGLSYAARLKLIFWNCVVVARMFLRRKL
ncbi:MAG: glycosyltransferase family 2 protein [Candidatus Liptonbacteria bacterium]|nr:glycosyltransferase family 2 protein [Candidatus Liptonbacteria bacterium]